MDRLVAVFFTSDAINQQVNLDTQKQACFNIHQPKIARKSRNHTSVRDKMKDYI